MRHGKRFNHLGRTKPHRKAMLSNMACSLIQHKRINTTLAKAKALRGFVEPLITKSKNDSTHSRRVVFKYLNDKEIVSELFRDVAPKVGERPGGYTRIIRTGNRLGDNAEMCMMELVDYNEIYSPDQKSGSKKKRRRRRRGGGSTSTSDDSPENISAGAVKANSEQKNQVGEDANKEKQIDDKAGKAKSAAEPKAEEPKANAPKVEQKKAEETKTDQSKAESSTKTSAKKDDAVKKDEDTKKRDEKDDAKK